MANKIIIEGRGRKSRESTIPVAPVNHQLSATLGYSSISCLQTTCSCRTNFPTVHAQCEHPLWFFTPPVLDLSTWHELSVITIQPNHKNRLRETWPPDQSSSYFFTSNAWMSSASIRLQRPKQNISQIRTRTWSVLGYLLCKTATPFYCVCLTRYREGVNLWL